MRTFETQGPVSPDRNYVVRRSIELSDFVNRIKQGRYIVIFAPRQTGKTTFFRWAIDALTDEGLQYFPIQLDFEEYKNVSLSDFYNYLYQDIRKEIENVHQKRDIVPSDPLREFLENTQIVNHVSLRHFFEKLARILDNQRIIIIIDEFDGIPQDVVSDFLHSLRRIYLSDPASRCIYSLGIVGVKSITQLNYDRSISPFNIQDEFALPNFTLEQVRELFAQYTDEVGQMITTVVIEALQKQTAGQPFLVNRLAQILTDELHIPKTETLQMVHFTQAHTRLLRERNTNIDHLLSNIRNDPRFESILMNIVSYEKGVRFNLDNELIDALTTYGIIAEGSDGMCEIVNPIYHYRIMQAFQPINNGLEDEYFSDDTYSNFLDYLTPDGNIQMQPLLDNFQNFISRAGHRLLHVPQTPQEFVGQYLLFAYLDQFVRLARGTMYLEVQTGRGRIDLLILHNEQKYIVETKIWEGESLYQAGKKQLAAYLKLEKALEGYYIVFDHRKQPVSLVETEIQDDFTIHSYVIPVTQETPSQLK
jgi:hypothetical protein